MCVYSYRINFQFCVYKILISNTLATEFAYMYYVGDRSVSVESDSYILQAFSFLNIPIPV